VVFVTGYREFGLTFNPSVTEEL